MFIGHLVGELYQFSWLWFLMTGSWRPSLKMAAKRVLSYRSWMSGSVFWTPQTSV